MIEQLNSRFGLDSIRFGEGQGGLTRAVLTTSHGETEIYLHGAHVTRFSLGGQPLLWMSKDAVFDGKKALRGGIPIIFPWFGPHPTDNEKPQHGFARNRPWEVLGTKETKHETTLELGLQNSPETKELWPFDFAAKVVITLGSALYVELQIENLGTAPFEVSPALHTYFAVEDISQVAISGFEGEQYIDQLQAGKRLEQRGEITFSEEVDRIYLRADESLSSRAIIHDRAADRHTEVASTQSNSAVVWNPWIDKSKRMSDFPDDGFQTMVCVETANAADDKRTVAPGEKHSLMQSMRLIELKSSFV